MNASQSDKYYFSRGDLVILVEHTLFRVHQDILERHSGFFEAMFASPSSDDKEGRSDESPLHLPQDLSSAQAFTTICKFLYPPLVGALPSVAVKDLDVWEPVLEATLALQFVGIQDYISRGLCNDKKNIHLFTPGLFNIADRIGDVDLKWECYYEFFYRVRPLSLDDGRILGASHLALITQVRELVRNDLWCLSRTDVETSRHCPDPDACRQTIIDSIHLRLAAASSRSRQSGHVFEISDNPALCSTCNSHRIRLASAHRLKKLDERVQKWVESLLPKNLSGDRSRVTQLGDD